VEVPVWELSISHNEDEYSFNLNNPSAGGLTFRETMYVPAALRDDIVARTSGDLSPADDPRFDERLAEAGRDVFHLMLPRSIQDVLTRMEGGHLAISTDDPAILWESAFFQDQFLGLRFAVARRMIARKVPDQNPRPERSSLEMLVIADPRGDLRQAANEARAIEEMFSEESLVQVRVVAQKEASTRNVLHHLSTHAYDIVHYAGHVDANEPGEATLKLSDGATTASYLAQRLSGVKPQIVFVNGCSSGRLAKQVEENPQLGGRWVASMAETFLTEGVGSYVGTLWDVADEAASKVAGRFYAALLEGAAVGDALMSARQSAADLGAAGWGAYLLYGRPNEMIAGIRPVIERRRNMSGLRKLIASENEVERRQAAISLGKLGRNEAAKELAAACYDPSEAVRWRAVEGLAKIGTPAAITALAEYLSQADPDSVLQVLVVARGKFGPEHWDAVSSLADPPHDRWVRANAIAALSWIGHDSYKTRMKGFLDDDDPVIQWAALNGLARLGSPADSVLQMYQPDELVLEYRRQRILGVRQDTPKAAAPRASSSERTVPIILDCDAGLDDSAAIALAALHPDCSLEAVSIAGEGNVTVADGVETASAVLQLCERDDVPVLPGIGRGTIQVAGERSKTFEKLADIIMRHEGRCTVVATGPLSNVALLLRAFPQLVNSIKEIVFLGCSFSATGNAGPVQEANVFADPEAAHAVFRSGARIKIVPLGVSEQLTVGEAYAKRMGAPGGRLLNQQLAVMLAPLLAYYRVVFGRDSCPLHDPMAVLLALRPDLFSLRRMAVSVELTGDLTRGMTVRDDRPEAEGDNQASRIEIAEAVELDAVREILTQIVEAPTPAQ
jgi:inosine-uridine nucleoside N-ribohydrolase